VLVVELSLTFSTWFKIWETVLIIVYGGYIFLGVSCSRKALLPVCRSCTMPPNGGYDYSACLSPILQKGKLRFTETWQ
jgi:hypothetical protein